MPLNEIENNLDHWLEGISSADSADLLEELKVRLLGKSGVVTSAFKSMGSLSPEDKRAFGERLNKIKDKLEQSFKTQKQKIAEHEIDVRLAKETVDVTLPPLGSQIGGLHFISKTIRRIKEFYQARGFLILDGPEIDDEFHNFDALNIPSSHPARQSQDTFYIKDFKGTLLRTQTSTVQIRPMQEKGVPIRMISLGKTYRSDNLDATHSPMFHQMECLVVDREPISVRHLKRELQKFLAFFFEKNSVDEIVLRLRPSYFPFTEPGLEVDCRYTLKEGELVISKDGDKWIEIAGSGMVHPNVYKACGLDPEGLYGFAFAFGLDRLVMLKNGIKDIRNLYDTDLRWLEHYA